MKSVNSLPGIYYYEGKNEKDLYILIVTTHYTCYISGIFFHHLILLYCKVGQILFVSRNAC